MHVRERIKVDENYRELLFLTPSDAPWVIMGPSLPLRNRQAEHGDKLL